MKVYLSKFLCFKELSLDFLGIFEEEMLVVF